MVKKTSKMKSLKEEIELIIRHQDNGGISSVTAWMFLFGCFWVIVIVLAWLITFFLELFISRVVVIDPNFYQFSERLLYVLFGARPVQMAGQYVTTKVRDVISKDKGTEEKVPEKGQKVPNMAAYNKPTTANTPYTTNFTIDEFSCSDGTPVPVSYFKNLQTLMDNLEVIREAFGGKKITISSGYRTKAHNIKIGGAMGSKHLTASAADFKVFNTKASQVQKMVEKLMDEGKIKAGGIGLGSSFTHYDIRGKKTKWTY